MCAFKLIKSLQSASRALSNFISDRASQAESFNKSLLGLRTKLATIADMQANSKIPEMADGLDEVKEAIFDSSMLQCAPIVKLLTYEHFIRGRQTTRGDGVCR